MIHLFYMDEAGSIPVTDRPTGTGGTIEANQAAAHMHMTPSRGGAHGWCRLLLLAIASVALVTAGGVIGAVITRMTLQSASQPATNQPGNLPPPAPSSGAAMSTFSDTSLGISLQYPAEWGLDTSKTTVGDVVLLDISFYSGKVALVGEREFASLGIERHTNAPDLGLDQWIRRTLKDAKGLLVLAPCPFSIQAIECLEIKSQEAFVESGNIPSQTTIWIRVPQRVYGVAWGQAGTLPFADAFKAAHGPRVLESMRFAL